MRTAPQLVAALADTLDSLLALGDELGPADFATPTGCPGWSVHDQFSHVADLESLLAGRQRTETAVPDLPHIASDSGRFMEAGIEARRQTPSSEVLAELRAVVAERMAALRTLTEDTDLKAEVDGFFGKVPLGRSLGIRVVDIYSHEQDIRRATGRRGHESGPAAELTLDRYTLAWPTTLAGVLPDGVTLRVDITGPTVRSLGFRGVGDGVERTETGEADVVVRMPFDAALALACGRADADPGAAEVTGDATVAAAVLSNLRVAP